jgi:hypothetical protein
MTTSRTSAASIPIAAQALDRMLQQLASARRGGRVVETGVDDDGSLAIADDPDEIVDRHGIVVRVFARAGGIEEILRCRPRHAVA